MSSAMRSDHASVLRGSEWNGVPNARVVVTSVDAGARRVGGWRAKDTCSRTGVRRENQNQEPCARAPPGGRGSRQAEGLCGIQEDRLGQLRGVPGPGGGVGVSRPVWSGLHSWPLGSGGSGGTGRGPGPRRNGSGPLSSELGLPEGSSLQWAGAVLQLTVSYLWF